MVADAALGWKAGPPTAAGAMGWQVGSVVALQPLPAQCRCTDRDFHVPPNASKQRNRQQRRNRKQSRQLSARAPALPAPMPARRSLQTAIGSRWRLAG